MEAKRGSSVGTPRFLCLDLGALAVPILQTPNMKEVAVSVFPEAPNITAVASGIA